MKNKGFTLIELLAVIVILAIIALIATPVILGIIDDTRTEAKKRTAEMVYTGVQYAYTTSLYKVNTTGNETVDEITLTLIDQNLDIDNVKTHTLDPNSNPTKLTITTKDSVICVVEGSQAAGFTVKCGNAEDDEAYLESKAIAKKSS